VDSTSNPPYNSLLVTGDKQGKYGIVYFAISGIFSSAKNKVASLKTTFLKG
jgi:hypothetical protein